MEHSMIGHPHRVPILKADQTYSFNSYFKMRFPLAEILRELDAEFQVKELVMPIADLQFSEPISVLRDQLERRRLRVRLTSEMARRETLIAPVLMEVAELTGAILNIEYPIEVNAFLSGDLDYYLESDHRVLVVEAKQADLTRGFNQLAAELIALDQWIELSDPILYGAVTTGDIWQFGTFDREQRIITQDVMLYRVPTDLETLVRILVGILGS
jgi:hypothetical protein